MSEAPLLDVARAGSAAALRSLLAVAGGPPPHLAAAVDALGATGASALHAAVWRNHAPMVEALLAAGADPDAPDAESGWTAVHRACYWGRLRALARLLAADGGLALPDAAGRTPLDLLSAQLAPLLRAAAEGQGKPPGSGGGGEDEAALAGGAEVFSWGNGSNWTLGTGCTGVALAPARVAATHAAGAGRAGDAVVALAAGKFHSAALTADGGVLTWGWGHGGRLGHPEAHIHAGESAVIAPRRVAALARAPVAALAAGKHHSLFATAAGEVFACGSNRHGQLGLGPGADTAPEPRRVPALRGVRVVGVAAANKHSVAVAAGGGVYAWGANALGQLGYGTTEAGASATPRAVEAMRGRAVVAAAAAKRHTLVLCADGEAWTWGHRGVTPRRVPLGAARGGDGVRFHRGRGEVARPRGVAVAAGAAHSCVLAASGAVLCWRSGDPALAAREVRGALAGRRAVAVAAGKYRTAVVTAEGDVFAWEGRADYFPAASLRAPEAAHHHAAPAPAQQRGGDGGTPVARGRPAGGGGSAPRGGSPAGRGELLLGSSPGGGGASWGSPFGGSSGRPAGAHLLARFAQEREAAAAAAGGARTPASAGRERGGAPRRGGPPADTEVRPQRVEGLKRAVAAAVGEKHSLALQRWSVAALPGLPPVPWLQPAAAALGGGSSPRREERAPAEAASPGGGGAPPPRAAAAAARGPPRLQALAEAAVARHLADPRSALALLEFADAVGAPALRAHCAALAVCNLDAVLAEARGGLEALPPPLVAELERLWLGARAATAAVAGGEAAAAAPGRWGSVLQPGTRPTAAPASLGDGGRDAGGAAPPSPARPGALAAARSPPRGSDSSFRDASAAAGALAAARLLRTLQRKLQQVEALEARRAAGAALDAQQEAKCARARALRAALAALEGGAAAADVQAALAAADGPPPAPAAPSGAGPSSSSCCSAAKPACAPKPQARAPPAAPPPPAAAPPPSPAAPVTPQVVGFAAGAASSSAAARPPAAAAAGAPAAGAPREARHPHPPRRGALSMFLRGELDAGAPAAAPAATPAPGPAGRAAPWAAAAAGAGGPQSLRAILDAQQQAAAAPRPPPAARGAARGGPATPAARVPLASFLLADAAPPRAAWGGAAGASPPGAARPLLAIQREQAALAAPAPRPPPAAGRPPAARAPAPPAAGRPPAGAGLLLGGSPAGRGAPAFAAAPPPPSRWYVPESEERERARAARKSLAAVQAEEAAVAALARRLGGGVEVRVVPRDAPR